MDKNSNNSGNNVNSNDSINANFNNNRIVPELVLNPQPVSYNLEDNQENVITAKPVTESASIENIGLSEQEKAMVKEFARKIDITHSAQILQYGSAAQKKIADFSENALSNVRTRDMDEVGRIISDLVVELKGFAVEDEPKGFMGIFRRTGRQINRLKAQYNTVEKNIDEICETLEKHKITLLKDITMLDKMYEMNLIL